MDAHRTPASGPVFHRKLAALKRQFDAMQPEMSLTVTDPVMELEAYVVVWNTGISQGGPLAGAGKGGTRCEATLDLAQVARLARTMALKNAAAGLPLGGAKSGVRMDRRDPNYERKWRRFVALTAPMLHERGGCFGGYGYDKGCRIPDNALWAIDELTRSGLATARSVTGKPVELGGTDYDAQGIAGLGVAAAARTLLHCHERSTKGARFAVQGIGAMGAAIASHFSALGAQLAALSDPLLNGTWVFDRPPDELLLRALAQRQLAELSQLLPVAGRLASANIAHVLELDVDVLFPAATEDVITSANADRVRARYVVEGANNPTTDEAHRVLFERGVHLVPDVIANAGGIIAAFVEMTTPSTAQIVAARSKVEQAKQMAATRIADNTERLIRMVRRLDIRPDEAGDYMALHALRFGVSDETPSTGADLHDRT